MRVHCAAIATTESRLHALRNLVAAVLAPPGTACAVALGLGVTGPCGPNQLIPRHRQPVDDRGAVRLKLGKDRAHRQRRSRTAGITIYDANGSERAGVVTFYAGSAADRTRRAHRSRQRPEQSPWHARGQRGSFFCNGDRARCGWSGNDGVVRQRPSPTPFRSDQGSKTAAIRRITTAGKLSGEGGDN